MGIPLLLGLGQGLQNAGQSVFEYDKMRRAAKELALQQALGQSLIKERSAHTAIEERSPLWQTFQSVIQQNPDWKGDPDVLDLARKLGYPLPSTSPMQGPQDPNAIPQNYPATGIPISIGRQLGLAQARQGITTADLTNKVLQQAILGIFGPEAPPQAPGPGTPPPTPPQGPGGVTPQMGPTPASPTGPRLTPASVVTGPPPPPAQRQEGQVYYPGGVQAVWRKGPDGRLGFFTPKPTDMTPPTGAQTGDLQDPAVRQRMKSAIGLGVIGKALGEPGLVGQVLTPPGQDPKARAAVVTAEQQARAEFPPALMQRGIKALEAASQETADAIQELEQRYPGIGQSAAAAQQPGAKVGWMGSSGGKPLVGGGLMDQVWMANEWAKYAAGRPTPLAHLFQNASFANIEQMAGQLPGTRGFQQLLPLFHQHQSKVGRESPLASYQRLIGMRKLMSETATEMQTPAYAGADQR